MDLLGFVFLGDFEIIMHTSTPSSPLMINDRAQIAFRYVCFGEKINNDTEEVHLVTSKDIFPDLIKFPYFSLLTK